MFCSNCGEDIPEGQNVCPSCGASINNPVPNATNTVTTPINNPESVNTTVVNSFDVPTKGLGALSLIFPPIGFVFYFISKKETPNRAKAALQGAWFGFVTYAVAALLFIFAILPIVKRYALKYQCVTNTPGAVYDYKTYTCTHPDGKEVQIMPK